MIPGALTNSFLGSLGVASCFVGFRTAAFCFDDFLLGLFELPSCCLSLGGTLLYFLFLYHIYDATVSGVLCWFCWLEFAMLGGVLTPSFLVWAPIGRTFYAALGVNIYHVHSSFF